MLRLRSILIVSVIYLLCGLFKSFAQKEASVWYFGDKAGIKFYDDSVSVLTDGEMMTYEGCASIADKQGNLLFYTDGVSVWNRQHKLMPNGQGLLGHKSSSQSAIIIPRPGSETIYYLCTVNGATGDPSLGAFYSEVDMSLDNSLGDITVNKNIPLIGPTDEKMTAVKHGNGRDIWLLIAERFSPRLHAYLVTSTGINTTAIISLLDSSIDGRIGCMKFSPSGKKVAISLKEHIVIGDFDPLAGKITKSGFLETKFHVTGLEFSPNNRYLYVGSKKLAQYDLHAGDMESTAQSEYFLTDSLVAWALQLALNNQIYFIHYDSRKHLGVIKNPNSQGPNCRVDLEAIYLKGKETKNGLPNFIQSYFNVFGYQSGSPCFPQSYFYLNDTSNIKNVFWDFGDTASVKANNSDSLFPVHVFSIPGIYRVQVIVEKINGYSDTIIKTIQVHNLPAHYYKADSATYCDGDTVALDVYLDNARYLWNTGDTTAHIKLTQGGIYTVDIILDSCTVTDTFYITFLPKPTVYIGPDTAFCGLPDFVLKPVSNGSHFKWNTGDTTKDLYVNKEGMYSLLVKNKEMCENADTVKISKIEYPFAFPYKDTVVCGDYIVLDAGNPGSTYLWSTGQQSRTINIKQAGIYTLTISNGICSVSDTVKVTFIPEDDCLPWLFIPNSFSPNGDDLNDVFKVEARNISSLNLEIYNRWGEKIFESSNPNIGWTGTYKNTPVPTDVYFYILRYSYPENGHLRKVNTNGTVQLLR